MLMNKLNSLTESVLAASAQILRDSARISALIRNQRKGKLTDINVSTAGTSKLVLTGQLFQAAGAYSNGGC
jgi:hypothetical protein